MVLTWQGREHCESERLWLLETQEKDGLAGHLLRDIGIVLSTTGLVVFAADYFTRKDFISLLTTKLEPLQDEVRTLTQSTLDEMTPLKSNMSTLLDGLSKAPSWR